MTPSRSRRRAPADSPKRADGPESEGRFLEALRQDLDKAQASLRRVPPETERRAKINQALLTDLWEIHNQFEQIGVHLAMDPPASSFAVFAEYPTQWSFRDGFDFASLSSLELGDRAAGWVGYTLRLQYYAADGGAPRFRAVYEWVEGESYHRYSGWMRTYAQAILYDESEADVDLEALHSAFKNLVVEWYGAHLERSPERLLRHLREKYPAGPSYSREAYR